MAKVSFAKDIVPLFDTATDVPHMARMGVQLTNYGYMSQPHHAQNVIDHIDGTRDPIMPPPPAQPWSAANIALFKAWMAGGYQP
jgi:hypothetical protein